jgi:concentrative nucleoside transporter, CNT family
VVYSLENARSLAGIAVILLVAWLLSEDKKRFPFLMTIGALAAQAGLVLALFALPNSASVLGGFTAAVKGLAGATGEGAQFVFGYLGGGSQPFAPVAPDTPAPFLFGFQVLPLILVISSLSALLWHWRILRWITRGFGFLFQKTMGLGGASALAVAACIFMGTIEAAIVVRGYLDKFTRAELFLLMSVGLATVAGSTMVAYALILGPTLPNAAGHVLVASIISAPAGVLLARIMIPEKPGEGGAFADYGSSLHYVSSMDAVTTGVMDGLKVVFNVAAMLIVFVAFVALANNLLGLLPDWNGAPLTLQRMLGFAFAPVAYLIGVPWREAGAAGSLLGVKLFLTEFIAFIQLGATPEDVISERTRMIMTYALCGFANVASVGIVSGGLSVLLPERRDEIFALVWKALIPGFMATLMTASVVAALPEGLFRQ